jgi:hypothetical protein
MTDSLPPNLVKLSGNDIDSLCRELAAQIKRDGYRPEIIVGIQRGGCVPAVFLSHLLDVPDLCTFGIRTTESEAVKAARTAPKVSDTEVLHRVRGRRVLLVDDVTNTGTTLALAKSKVSEFNPSSCKTAVIIWDGDGSAGCSADYVADRTPSWVVFPWEA